MEGDLEGDQLGLDDKDLDGFVGDDLIKEHIGDFIGVLDGLDGSFVGERHNDLEGEGDFEGDSVGDLVGKRDGDLVTDLDGFGECDRVCLGTTYGSRTLWCLFVHGTI